MLPCTDEKFSIVAEIEITGATGKSLVIQSLMSSAAWVLTRDVPSGGMWPGPMLAMRANRTELASEPDLMTRLFVSPRLLISGPLMMPAWDSGVENRASHKPSAEPPG